MDILDSVSSGATIAYEKWKEDIEDDNDENASFEVFRSLNEELVGIIHTKIVGVRYYTGVVHAGEFVTLVREPQNQYDSNAIAVHNMAGGQVGHVNRQLAMKLAPPLDITCPGGMKFEATIPNTPNSQFTIDMKINVLAVSGQSAQSARRWMQNAGLSSSIRSMARQNVNVVRSIGKKHFSQKQFDDMMATLDNEFAKIEDIVPNLDNILLATLHPHQRQGVSWMLTREQSEEQLLETWETRTEQGRKVYFNSITNSSTLIKPKPVLGGILADEMGLGKTLQVITLILSNPPKNTQWEPMRENSIDSTKQESKETTTIAWETVDVGTLRYYCDLNQLQMDGSKSTLMKRLKSQNIVPTAEINKTIPEEFNLSSADLKKKLKEMSLKTSGTIASMIKRIQTTRALNTVDTDDRKPTLIVCPTSVLSSWNSQIEEHVAAGVLKFVVYHGASREQKLHLLPTYDIVLTTYGTLTSECTRSDKKGKRKAGPATNLSSIKWRRVVLDEAHKIRTRNTQTNKAVNMLDTKYSWGLTGTPLINSASDIQALLEFLGAKPIADPQVFKQAIMRPIQQFGDKRALQLLRVITRAYLLRRTKRATLKHLQAPKVELHKVNMESGQLKLYNTIFHATKKVFVLLLGRDNENSTISSNYNKFVVCLLRLRQVCCAPQLITQKTLDAANAILNDKSLDSVKELTKEEATALLDRLEEVLDTTKPDEEGVFECVICLEELDFHNASVIRGCMHAFCGKCLDTLMGKDGSSTHSCPLCRRTFSATEVVPANTLQQVVDEPTIDVKEEKEKDEVIFEHAPSVKIDALIQDIQKLQIEKPDERVVVFSSFRRFLDLINQRLHAENITCCQLDGRTTLKKRLLMMKTFSQEKDGPMVMLISLKSGGEGINLIRANNVYMMDAWWNRAAEDQACDRVHRIGQKRQVRVVHYITTNSVEEAVQQIQKRKIELTNGVLSKKTPKQLRVERISVLRKMFMG